MTPTCEITGLLQTISKKTFEDDMGKTVTFYQVALMTEDEYKPLLTFTLSEALWKLNNFEDEKVLVDWRGKQVTLFGHIFNQSKKIAETWHTLTKVKIDTDITLLDN